MPTLLIYGATGYTGRLATQHAKQLGLDIVVGGRSESTKTFASELGLPYRLFDLEETERIDVALNSITVLLNCAGPFFRTAEPLITACIRNKVHYLDVAAELDSYRLAEKHDAQAKATNVMLLPGCGGSVAMLGCLAGHTVSRVSEKPSRIDIALYVAGSMSRGSAISASENLTAECLQVVDGELVPQEEEEASSTLQLDFDNGAGPVTNYPVTLPDLITLRRSTAVPNIRTFVHAAGDAFPSGGNLAALPDGPTAEQRDAAPYHAAVLVTAADGSVKRSVLHTVNGYTFTGKASAEAAGKVLAGVVRAGFQTPAEVFGRRFVEVVEGSNVVDF